MARYMLSPHGRLTKRIGPDPIRPKDPLALTMVVLHSPYGRSADMPEPISAQRLKALLRPPDGINDLDSLKNCGIVRDWRRCRASHQGRHAMGVRGGNHDPLGRENAGRLIHERFDIDPQARGGIARTVDHAQHDGRGCRGCEQANARACNGSNRSRWAFVGRKLPLTITGSLVGLISTNAAPAPKYRFRQGSVGDHVPGDQRDWRPWK